MNGFESIDNSQVDDTQSTKVLSLDIPAIDLSKLALFAKSLDTNTEPKQSTATTKYISVRLKLLGPSRLKFTSLPDEIYLKIFKHLKKKDVATMKQVHRNFHNAANIILFYSIVVCAREYDFYSFPPEWLDYTFTKLTGFLQLMRSPNYDESYNKRLIFVGPFYNELDYIIEWKEMWNHVEIYVETYNMANSFVNIALKSAIDGSEKNYMSVNSYTSVMLDEDFFEVLKISGPRVNFRHRGISCSSIILESSRNTHLLEYFDLSKLVSLRVLEISSDFASSLKPYIRKLVNLKELGIVKDRDVDVVLGFKRNSLTKLEVCSSREVFSPGMKKLIYLHCSSLVTLVLHRASGSRIKSKEMPLLVRFLKIEDFKNLREIVYEGGKLLVDRSVKKPKLVYSPY
ncbi:hypothetical protein G210_4701 [Candida maltosa Xu316]|uniref:F-box domain-containing protein n=1 Tax=Candida maltosa (strain Xu316) TaxID=1245528 RepID=M3K634_CANMX|nr:hypothetical protein G210_4701 [Candida maltosa Xu316]